MQPGSAPASPGRLDSPQAITMSIQTEHPITLRSLYLELQQVYEEGSRVFINGLQSWTESREYSLDERIPPLRGPFPRLLNTTGDYTFFNYSNKSGHLHSHMSTYLQSPAGARKQWTEHATGAGYTIFQHWIPESLLGIYKECAGMDIGPHKEVVLFDISIVESLHGQAPTPGNLAEWAEELPAPCIGWTSWYHYYTRITEGIILQNLTAFQSNEVPAGVFQIDDGWQPAVGDWTSANAKFPQGMAWLAGQIHAAGHQAGLWLAPFIVEQKSKVFLEHPEWLLTHDGEHPVAAGFNPGWGGIGHGTYYVLDIAQPEVQAHLADVFRVVLQDWGYDLVKLDFLFSVGLLPRMGQSRGQWMRLAMQLLRDWCGDKLILGCGVPLGPARGLVDYCRIGPDVGLHWDMRSAKLIHLRERISTLNALRNTISRFALPEKGFRNDPDVFILRSTKNRLLPAQRHSSFLLNNLLGDLIFSSDNIAEYDAPTLALYLSAFPVPQSRRIRTHDLGQDHYQIDAVMDGRHYLVFANLGKKAWDAPLPPGSYACGPATRRHVIACASIYHPRMPGPRMVWGGVVERTASFPRRGVGANGQGCERRDGFGFP
jgi:hypothetical protein